MLGARAVAYINVENAVEGTGLPDYTYHRLKS